MNPVTNPPKVIYVGTLPPHPGGSAISCVQLLQGLAQYGFGIRAIAPIASGLQETQSPKGFGFPTSRFTMSHFDTTPHLPPSADFLHHQQKGIQDKLLPLIHSDIPDVIIVGRESFAWHVPDIAKTYDIPTLLCIRGNPTHSLINGTYPKDATEQLISHFHNNDAIVTNATHMANGMRKLGFKAIQTIPNFVNNENFRPLKKNVRLLKKLDISTKDIVVMLVSNIKEKKRPMDVVYSAQKALKTNPNLLYVIVGEGDQKHTMIEMCKQMNIYDRFRFTGWVDYAQMPQYMNLADIMLMPSQAEAIARVYLETMACKCPLIASDIPGSREVITHGKTGFLFSVGDISKLMRHTLVLAQNASLRQKVGHNAYQKSQSYGYESVVSQYATLLQKLIHTTKKQHSTKYLYSHNQPRFSNLQKFSRASRAMSLKLKNAANSAEVALLK